ncbi:MAG TPA: prephenate dehydratase [Chitinophagaceae bacterium]|nr:prephenate dehydratase [Chitinophagaceae bacterium]
MSLKIAIQGFEGCFHQIAAQHYFGRDMEIVPCVSFGAVARSVGSRDAAAGVMAIENSIAGSILPNYHLLQQSSLYVVGEIYLNIQQHLMMLPGGTLEDIHEVHSHPMALLQCMDFLEQHPGWRLVETEDTALSAKMLGQHHAIHRAAIAGKLAAELYGLTIVSPAIQTEKKNYTRFLVLSKQENKRWEEGPNKASVYFQVANTHGCLAKVLTCIGEEGINLSKLQSFPVPGGEWKYFFHTDMEFEKVDQLHHAVEKITPLTEKLRVLGVYRKGLTV